MDVAICKGSQVIKTGRISDVESGTSENSAAFARFATSTGADFTALLAPTFGVSNPALKTEFRIGTSAVNAMARRSGGDQPDHVSARGSGAEFIELPW